MPVDCIGTHGADVFHIVVFCRCLTCVSRRRGFREGTEIQCPLHQTGIAEVDPDTWYVFDLKRPISARIFFCIIISVIFDAGIIVTLKGIFFIEMSRNISRFI